MTIGELGVEESDAPRLVDVDDPDIREIFPVPEHEVLVAGDVLLLSLPREACVAFVNSASRLHTSLGSAPSRGAAGTADALQTLGLRICDMDLLEIPGRQGEFVELVVSRSNPFVGTDFTGEGRRAFEEHYQVAVLAVRQNTLMYGEMGEKKDHLLSYANQKSVQLLRQDSVGSANPVIKEGPSQSFSTEEASEEASPVDSTFRDLPSLEWDDEQQERGPRTLRSGDAVLVLAKTGAGSQGFAGQDFLAQTMVAHEADFVPTATDYVPLLLFIVGIVLVATQQVTMVQTSMALAAIYLACGWVSPKELREGIDWNMLVLIGCALGLAKAVQESGLSGAVASSVKGAKLGPRGTVTVLFLFTMVVTELVTNNAAAALAYPLASDLSKEMSLSSVKPLAMTVMLATSACYMNPIGTAPNLMVMGPGGYTFKDYLKVGFLMDMICWVTAIVFVPLVWPMVESPTGPPKLSVLVP